MDRESSQHGGFRLPAVRHNTDGAKTASSSPRSERASPGRTRVPASLPVCGRLLARLHVKVADCPLDVLAALALRAFSHAAIVFLYAHVRGEMLLTVLADKVVVRLRGTLALMFSRR